MKTNKIIGFICCFAFLLGTFISIIDYWCFNNQFYQMEYEQLNTADHIGMSSDDLNKTTNVLLSYLRDRDLTLDVEANVKGNNRQVFNERERAHMVDVRELYFNAMSVRNISFVVFVLFLFILIYKKELSILFVSYKRALLLYCGIFLLIALFCLIDFDAFWTNFHYIFFPGNDLWLLNPSTDILIMMVPSKFFFDLCVTIVFSLFVVLVVLFVLLKVLDKKVFNHD